MKRIRLDRCAVQFQPPRNPRLPLHQEAPFSTAVTSRPRNDLHDRRWRAQCQWQCQKRHAASRREASSAAATAQVEAAQAQSASTLFQPNNAIGTSNPSLNAPSHKHALRSAKLAALHARLALPAKLPLQTLARCLIDQSVDSRPGYNNAPFAVLGQELLGYYTSEWLMCHYPRLPLPVLQAAQYGYAGNKTLAALRAEWGVELVAAPGPEVDAGLLQLKRASAGNAMADGEQIQLKNMPSLSRLGSAASKERAGFNKYLAGRVVQNDEFGDVRTDSTYTPFPGAQISAQQDDTNNLAGRLRDGQDAEVSSTSSIQDPPRSPTPPNTATVEDASAVFVRALAGALYLHAGANSIKTFHKDHLLSRHLPLHTLFNFTHPTRDLSRLCAREGFEPPVARLISETGRLSRAPVFVVGVFSGDDKLGEAAGSSLNEGRVRAAAAALRAWYLYSPPSSEIVLPSDLDRSPAGRDSAKQWKPQMIDIGEIIT